MEIYIKERILELENQKKDIKGNTNAELFELNAVNSSILELYKVLNYEEKTETNDKQEKLANEYKEFKAFRNMKEYILDNEQGED